MSPFAPVALIIRSGFATVGVLGHILMAFGPSRHRARFVGLRHLRAVPPLPLTCVITAVIAMLHSRGITGQNGPRESYCLYGSSGTKQVPFKEVPFESNRMYASGSTNESLFVPYSRHASSGTKQVPLE